MKVVIDGEEVFSKRYETFEAMSEEYIDHETGRGRRVPDYELDAYLMAIAVFVLDKAYDEFRGWLSRRQQSELDEERHSKVLSKLDEVLRATENSENDAEFPSREAQAQAEGKNRVLALLEWAQENNMDVSITIETDAEGDLKEAFDALTEQKPRGLSKDDSDPSTALSGEHER